MATSGHRLVGLFLGVTVLLGTGAQAAGQVREPQRSEIRGFIKSVNTAAITIALGGGREAPATDKMFALLKNVEVAVASGTGRSLGPFKEGKLADLTAGLMVNLALTADQKTVESILVEEPMVRGVLKAVNPKLNTLTVNLQVGREQDAEERTYSLAAGSEIAIDDGRGRRLSIKEGKLDDLAAGALVNLRLTLDKKQVTGILAEGATLTGTIKARDPAKKILTLVLRPGRGEEQAEERILPVADEAVVLIDDGKGRRLSLKEARLADVPVGAAATVKLFVDQSWVMHLHAEGPTVTGLFKAADPAKGTITIAIPKGREADEKSFPLATDARILIDGNDGKLANIKAGDNGPIIQLRLSLDQKTVQLVVARQPQSR